MVAGKQTSFCWWTGTYNPSEMQGTKTCRLASNDKTRKDAGRKGLSVGGQRYKPVTKGRISAETVKNI